MRVRAKQEIHDRTLDEFDNQHLSPGREYLVVGYDEQFVRVVNDVWEPILYPWYLFEVIDSSVPTDWIRVEEGDGEYSVNPPECNEPGFYESFFDGEPSAKAQFARVLLRLR